MRVGVFGNHDSWYVHELCRFGISRGHEVFPLLFDKVTVMMSLQGVSYRCWNTDNTEPRPDSVPQPDSVELESLDVILVRTMPPGTLEQVVSRMDVLAGLQSSGVRVVNPPKSLECAVDKYLTTQKLAETGLPVPATAVCEDSDAAMLMFEQLGGDVVVKPLFGAEGRGIMRVSDPELALRCFRTLERLGAVLYLQQFLQPGAGAQAVSDIRVLLLDGEVVGAMKRTARAGDFRANVAQQGTAVPHAPSPREVELARRATEVTGCVFAGVDLMYDAAGNAFVIEVNAVPGWRGLQKTCGVCVPTRLYDWLER
ncbi:MAG: RimK family alpha-L-glutamate ligase [Planctomycetaceae bacterium]|nr:RimK family alpha-L-glutamate ligase [Planctomycetaceae bacterium]